MNILVRLPNWLGDVVMSLPSLQLLRDIYPNATIEVIVKKGLEAIVERAKTVDTIHSFSKKEYKGLFGAYRFGKQLTQQKQYELFVCLPDSFSSAAMAYATRAKQRIGYKKELRSLFFTRSFVKPTGLHRVEEYASLLKFNFHTVYTTNYNPRLYTENNPKRNYVVVNVNSEAISRQLPVSKAVELINVVQRQMKLPIKLVGGPADIAHVQKVYDNLVSKENVSLLAGKTTLSELIDVIENAAFVLSTDSGPAHIAGAANVPVIVLFGAGNESNTGPYCNNNAIVIRNGKLPCEPCVKNTCKLQTLPLCLVEIDADKVEKAIHKLNI